MDNRIGQLAKQYCQLTLRLDILKSNAGYYIGTTDIDGCPCSRESEEYYTTRELAKQALDNDTFTQRTHP